MTQKEAQKKAYEELLAGPKLGAAAADPAAAAVISSPPAFPSRSRHSSYAEQDSDDEALDSLEGGEVAIRKSALNMFKTLTLFELATHIPAIAFTGCFIKLDCTNEQVLFSIPESNNIPSGDEWNIVDFSVLDVEPKRNNYSEI